MAREARLIEVHPLFKDYIDELKAIAKERGQKKSDADITLALRDILKGMPINSSYSFGKNG